MGLVTDKHFPSEQQSSRASAGPDFSKRWLMKAVIIACQLDKLGNLFIFHHLKARTLTNFTFWKVILLEIHEVHLIQGNQFLGTTSEMDTLSSIPSNDSFVKFPSKLRPLTSGRSE